MLKHAGLLQVAVNFLPPNGTTMAIQTFFFASSSILGALHIVAFSLFQEALLA
jgi:hypothetical protein